ncbi:unnamed protein product, partial [Gongylonema pulchrum]|uniref:Uncharacterized protein n=1 Tax=Gongylonema pulchrum TaxID=637853 RepID=A0A183D250_9BILA
MYEMVCCSATPKQSQTRSSTAISRSPSTAAGLHLQLGGGLLSPSMAAAAAAAAAGSNLPPPLQGSLPSSALPPGVLGSSIPLAPNLPGATASITNGTSEAAAQAAMYAALQNAQQNAAVAAAAAAGLPNGTLSSAPYLLPAAAQQHPLSAVTSQAQSVYPSQRLFDPGMTAVLQQMQSMEALRQSAAAAQMNAAAAAAAAHVPVSGGASATPSSIDLVRLQMEQQMME